MTRSKVVCHDDRPGWDEYFLGISASVAARGDCRRSQVGAVLVGDTTHWIYGTGYNGVAPGRAGCLMGECPRGLVQPSEYPVGGTYQEIPGHPCVAIHAEENALNQALVRFGAETLFFLSEKMTMYITRKCCYLCEYKLRMAGVSRVTTAEDSIDISPWKM